MIKANQVIDLLLEACPSYKPRWEEYFNENYKDAEQVEINNCMDVFSEAAPAVKAKLEEYNEYMKDNGDGRLLYIDLADFSNHLIDLLKRNELEEFPEIFHVIEELHIIGDDYVREAATIGLLEDLQTLLINHEIDSKKIKPFLKSESLKWWDSLDKFHSGKIKYVGEDLKNK